MSTIGNPLVQQGMLNRVLTHIIVPSFPQLNVTSPYMSKSLATLTFDESAVDQIGTATGVVNSPKPYVMGKVVVNLLRSQGTANLYLAQWQSQAPIGTIVLYSDSTALQPITLLNCSLLDVDTGAFDGVDPTFKATISGVFETNAYVWAGT